MCAARTGAATITGTKRIKHIILLLHLRIRVLIPKSNYDQILTFLPLELQAQTTAERCNFITSMQRTVFEDVTPCCRVDKYQHFWGIYCLHFQSRKVDIKSIRLKRVIIFTARSRNNSVGIAMSPPAGGPRFDSRH